MASVGFACAVWYLENIHQYRNISTKQLLLLWRLCTEIER